MPGLPVGGDEAFTQCATGAIAASFTIAGRGRAFLLQSVTGSIDWQGKLWNGERLVRFNGPDYARVAAVEGGEQLAFTMALSDVGTCGSVKLIEFYTAAEAPHRAIER